MNITISRALPLPEHVPARPEYVFQLREGFWFVVDDDDQVVIEPLLLYLVYRFIYVGRNKNHHTHKATAYDLADWWSYLNDRQIRWTTVDTALLSEYRDARLGKISSQTHELLKSGTVKRRLANVIAFYKWAHSRQMVDCANIDEREVCRIPHGINADPLAHIRSSFIRRSVSLLLPAEGRRGRMNIHFIPRAEWARLKVELGPLPSESEKIDDRRTSRNRLAAELSLATGMRVLEVASLTTLQILDLAIPPDALPHDLVMMPLTITKLNKKRNVLVPVYLVRELLHYIDHERKGCIADGKQYGLKRHNWLFVNGVGSRHHVGKEISPDMFDRSFRAAALQAGLVRHVEKIHPETGERYVARDVKYTFHDLRHSFAVYQYMALQEAGVTMPWLEVSQRLGHESVQTTTRTYLAHLDEARMDINSEVFKAMRRMWGGD